MAGLVLTRDPEIEKSIAFVQNAEGTAASPFDCWLLLRGIKTLSVRVDRQNENACRIAHFLADHPAVKKIYWPGVSLSGHPKLGIPMDQVELHARQTVNDGGCSIMSLELEDDHSAAAFVESCKILKITVSFGGVNSLIEMPGYFSHASIPSESRTLPKDLIRISIGIEDVRDIQEDIEQAIAAAKLDAASAEAHHRPNTTTVGAQSGRGDDGSGSPGHGAESSDNGRFDSKFEDLPLTPGNDE